MRLIGLIIAALLAVAVGILVMSAPQAVASAGRIVLSSSADGYAPRSYVPTDMGHGHDVWPPAPDNVSAQGDCGDPASGNHGGAKSDCCNMGACHAVQALVAPTLRAPFISAAVTILIGDAHLAGITTGGLDKPPRTV